MVPILHWPDFDTDPTAFSAALGRACRETGFFLLTGHPVSHGLIDAVFTQADALFSLPAEEKESLSITRTPHNRGWVAMGAERLDATSGQPDRKEAFNVGLDLAANDPRVVAGEPFRGVNVWPRLPGFRETLTEYFTSAWRFGTTLHRAIALDLGLPEDHFAPHFTEPMAILRLLSYPPSTSEGMAAGAHTDYGSLTLLMTDGEPGLQVRRRGGGWEDVAHVDGAFVVNIGDCLMRWTNDIYVSTPHRVLPPARKRRSVAFFLDPNPDSVIEALPGTGAPAYPPVTGADYLRSRLDATYAPERAG